MSFEESVKTSIFDCLRPAAGQTVMRAVIATYSLDLVAALGLILALGGHGEAELAATPLELVDAFEAMRGRLKILHQSGRVVAPRKHRSILLLLDDMLIAIDADENNCSWHPKIALVRYVDDGGDWEWRFWIGSRNLTGSTDLDAGILLIGRPRGVYRRLPDVEALASGLLARSSWTVGELEELRTAHWEAPRGVRVTALRWRLPGTKQPFIQPRKRLGPADETFGISPFVNKNGLRIAFGEKDAAGTLLTSRPEARKISSTEGVKVLIRGQPQPHIPVPEPGTSSDNEPDFVEPAFNGVHAKLLLRCQSDKAELMIGSSNLTERGLVGPNAEAVAFLEIKDPTLISSLKQFIWGHLSFVEFEPNAEEVRLEAAKRELDIIGYRFLQVPFRLECREDGLHVVTDTDIDDLLKDADLRMEAFGSVSINAEWLPGQRDLRLTAQKPVLKEQSALVIMHLASRNEPKVAKSWTQKLPFPLFDVELRDRAVLASYVGGTRFRNWLRSLVDGIMSGGGSRWSDPPPHRGPPGPPTALGDTFTLETMLARWTRNPAKFEVAVGKMSPLLSSFRSAFEALPEGSERDQALADINEVEPFLQSLIASVMDDAK